MPMIEVSVNEIIFFRGQIAFEFLAYFPYKHDLVDGEMWFCAEHGEGRRNTYSATEDLLRFTT